MDRTDIEKFFSTEDGFITDPGKYEGEPIWAPMLVACMEEGNTEVFYPHGDMPEDYLEIDDAIREEFPEIDEETDIISMIENSYGFVSVKEWTFAEWEEHVSEFSNSSEDSDDNTEWD